MYPDTRTLILGMAISCCFLVLVLATLWRQQGRAIGGLGEWSLAYLQIALWSALTVSFPEWVQLWVPAICLALSMVIAHLLIYEGLRRFLLLRRDYRLSITLLLASFAGMLLASALESSALRFLSASTTILLSYLLVLRAIRRSNQHLVASGVFTLLALIMTLAFLLRLASILGGERDISVYALSEMQQFVTLVFALLVPMAGMSLVLMVNERVQQRLNEQATRDALTGIFNRRAFLAAAEVELERSRRYGTSLGLVQIDLDHFKRVNDTYGHQAGDRVLVDFAARVSALLRATDVFGRMGGEEFILLLPQTGLDESLQVAERIRSSLAEAQIQPAYTASFGVATAAGGAPAIEILIGNADAALYRAKSNGRNRVEFTPAP
ncbi:GGDEF domain-containing protein [Pseudomonas sp. N040]|uniref:GGDEF domain-containing protein n=1 Tax=Pseudomonas sp. N040 TaxID=2785325 RepID=UPI0018A25EBF|nr:GGDEF domain-containing protein [Pseudomonas sp. N040]MBF7728951.1 GGDEF domain-containing protein [Pseudomonas sp. N040]MBW7012591.1 GGDEF domain-containing protein [Pseudomonas sp. N040]